MKHYTEQEFETAFQKLTNDFVDDFSYSNDLDDPILDHIDSLEFVEMVMQIEDEYEIEIPDEKLEEIMTFNQLKKLIKSKLSIE